jgi:lambda family phage tail tape measure protein
MLVKTNSLALERLDLERSLVGVSEIERKTALAAFDANATYQKKDLEFEGKILELKKQRDNSEDPNSFQRRINELEKERAAYKNQNIEIEKRVKLLTEAQAHEKISLALIKEQEQFQKDLTDLQQEYADYTKTEDQRKLSELEKQFKEAKKRIDLEMAGTYGTKWRDNAAAVKEEADAVDILTKSFEKNRQQLDKNVAQSRDFTAAWEKAFNQYVDDANNGAKHAQAVFTLFTNTVDSAIDQFVTTGKVKFGELAVSFIQEIETMMLKAAAAKFLGALGIGGEGGLFAGLFAEGGDIPTGKFGIVGEAGPELIKGPASVISAKDTAGMTGGGGGGTTIINNISAIDSRSVAQLFAENRQILFGNVEQARKEMPMRTR